MKNSSVNVGLELSEKGIYIISRLRVKFLLNYLFRPTVLLVILLRTTAFLQTVCFTAREDTAPLNQSAVRSLRAHVMSECELLFQPIKCVQRSLVVTFIRRDV